MTWVLLRFGVGIVAQWVVEVVGFYGDVDLREAVEDFAAKAGAEASGGGFHFAELACQIAGGAGDGHDAEGGAVPDQGLVQLGDGDVEAVAELVFERAHDLSAVFEGVRVLDG